MTCVIVSAWIPRSDTHIYEIGVRLKDSPLPVEKVSVGEKLAFTATVSEKVKANACMTHYGLFSFKADVEDVNGFVESVKHVLVEQIFKKCQEVTYKQVRSGIIPLPFHTTVLGATDAGEGLDFAQEGRIRAAFDAQKIYLGDSVAYVDGVEPEGCIDVLDYFAYTVLAGAYVNKMVEGMSEIYKNISDVEAAIEREDVQAIQEMMTKITCIRKDCSEKYGKLKQAVANFECTWQGYCGLDLEGDCKHLDDLLRIGYGFEKLKRDSDYVLPLWSDVLIKNIENLNFMVNTRLGLQQNIESQKEEKEMKLLQAIFLVGVIASIIALGAMPGATLTLYSADGDLIGTGELVSFNMQDLLSFGVIAVIVSVVFFVVFNWAYFKVTQKMRKMY